MTIVLIMICSGTLFKIYYSIYYTNKKVVKLINLTTFYRINQHCKSTKLQSITIINRMIHHMKNIILLNRTIK